LRAACASTSGRINVTLGIVGLVSAVFYVWTAATSVPLSLHDGSQDRYNLLASALLHFHLSIGSAPAGLMHLSDPYKPEINHAYLAGRSDAASINDDVLYDGKLYFVWGAAPALVLLVPLHLLGFEPSASVTVAVFSVVGLCFALATLRVLIGQLGDLPIWMCALAGLALSSGSAIPFLLRTPSVSEDILAGGYCFTMAGLWLAAVALVSRSASVPRLALMSVCFGLAAGSRPTLGLCALTMIPVYLRLRGTRSRRSLGVALGLPLFACFVLLLAYNEARFHQPLEVGSRYQLTGYDSRDAPLGHLSYALPGAWFYLSTPPQLMVLFPFIALSAPKATAPAGLASPEVTGGLLPMTPIVAFAVALPWLWSRRPTWLGSLAVPLMTLAGTGLTMMLVVSYQFFASTERYEVDFATLFVLAGLAAWLALSNGRPGPLRLLLRVGGAILIVWGCAAGFAASFVGYGDFLKVRHPQTWRTLEDAGAPLSTAIAKIIGHPVLGASLASTTDVTGFILPPNEPGTVTIVSPDKRVATLLVSGELQPGTEYRMGVEVPGFADVIYPAPHPGGRVEVPVHLHGGLNRVSFSPVALSSSEIAVGQPVMRIITVSLKAR
jgi:hypothetical protein